MVGWEPRRFRLDSSVVRCRACLRQQLERGPVVASLRALGGEPKAGVRGLPAGLGAKGGVLGAARLHSHEVLGLVEGALPVL